VQQTPNLPHGTANLGNPRDSQRHPKTLAEARGNFSNLHRGSLLLQNGATIVYVKEQMGHSSIQVTVDTYGHLIPGANVSYVDRLDQVSEAPLKTSPPQNATPAQQPENCKSEIPAEVTDLIGGGAWTRTTDLRIMRPSL
jgi:hypothetical protein